jgi:lysozyme
MVSKTKSGLAGGTAAAVALAVSIAQPAEGYVPYVYRDAVGVLTYCYGETQNARDMQGRRFAEAECHALLVKRMAHYDQGNAACVVNWPLLPVEVRGAYDSFSYNLGNGAFCNSTAAKYLRGGEIRKACMEMGKFVNGRVKGVLKPLPGLIKRRAVEQMICLRGAPK